MEKIVIMTKKKRYDILFNDISKIKFKKYSIIRIILNILSIILLIILFNAILIIMTPLNILLILKDILEANYENAAFHSLIMIFNRRIVFPILKLILPIILIIFAFIIIKSLIKKYLKNRNNGILIISAKGLPELHIGPFPEAKIWYKKIKPFTQPEISKKSKIITKITNKIKYFKQKG